MFCTSDIKVSKNVSECSELTKRYALLLEVISTSGLRLLLYVHLLGALSFRREGGGGLGKLIVQLNSVIPTSAITLYIMWYQLIPHKARVFLPCLVRMYKNIYLGYNDKGTRQIGKKGGGETWHLLGIWPRKFYDRKKKKKNQNQNY